MCVPRPETKDLPTQIDHCMTYPCLHYGVPLKRNKNDSIYYLRFKTSEVDTCKFARLFKTSEVHTCKFARFNSVIYLSPIQN